MAERLDLPCATRSTICTVPRAQNSIKHAPTTYVYASLHYVPALRDRAAVARRAHNPEVVGSNPTPATIPITNGRCLAASAVCRVPFPRFPLRGGNMWHEGTDEGVGARKRPSGRQVWWRPPSACGSPPPPARACHRRSAFIRRFPVPASRGSRLGGAAYLVVVFRVQVERVPACSGDWKFRLLRHPHTGMRRNKAVSAPGTGERRDGLDGLRYRLAATVQRLAELLIQRRED